MKFQRLLIAGIIVELCLVPMFEAKRSFGIARSRNKNKGPSVRRNQQGHDFDDHHSMPAAAPKPSAPEMKKSFSHAPPAGPPPAYPGMGHHAVSPHGAPPGYSQSYANPPSYSSGYNNHGSFGQPHHNQFSPYGGGMGGGMMGGGMMGGGMPMGGGVPMGSPYMAGNYGRSSGFGSGIMTNLFAGLAGYQLAKAFSGGHGSRDREVIIIQNPPPVDSSSSHNTNGEQTPKQSSDAQLNFNSPVTENPTNEQMTQVGPANNEYNFYGIPQYGIPLYGYNLPSQITDYYQTAIVKTPQMPQPISGK